MPTCKCFLTLVSLLTLPNLATQDHWNSGVCTQRRYGVDIRGRRLPYSRFWCSTGSAGLIQTISLFAHHTWGAAVVGLLATIGWVVQGVGNMYFYRQVRIHCIGIHSFLAQLPIRRYTPTIQPRVIQWKRLVLTIFS